MPMGLKNASQTLQRYIDTVLMGEADVIAYCDDILLFTQKDSHLKRLDELLKQLHRAGLVVNKDKSEFCCQSVKFLGHQLNSNGFTPSQDRIIGLQKYSVPKNQKQLRRFLGMINFIRKFIPNIAEYEAPLTSLTSKNVPFVWSTECQASFEKLIQLASETTQLNYPSPDDKYILTTDASNVPVWTDAIDGGTF